MQYNTIEEIIEFNAILESGTHEEKNAIINCCEYGCVMKDEELYNELMNLKVRCKYCRDDINMSDYYDMNRGLPNKHDIEMIKMYPFTGLLCKTCYQYECLDIKFRCNRCFKQLNKLERCLLKNKVILKNEKDFYNECFCEECYKHEMNRQMRFNGLFLMDNVGLYHQSDKDKPMNYFIRNKPYDNPQISGGYNYAKMKEIRKNMSYYSELLNIIKYIHKK